MIAACASVTGNFKDSTVLGQTHDQRPGLRTCASAAARLTHWKPNERFQPAAYGWAESFQVLQMVGKRVAEGVSRHSPHTPLSRQAGPGGPARAKASAPRVAYRALIRHTSDTWQPRPLPPVPGSMFQRSSSSESAVASAGMSNSSGRKGTGFSM